MTVVERDYPNVYKRFTALGPLMNKVGNGGKGIAWNTEDEVKQLPNSTARTAEGVTCGMPKNRKRYRRLRGDPATGAGDQRSCRRQGVGCAGKQTGRITPILALAS